MKKHLKRILTAASAMLMLLCVFAVPVSADRKFEDVIANIGLYDPDSVFGESDYSEANSAILETSSSIDMYIAVQVTGEDAPEYSDGEIEAMADDMYDELFNIPHGAETDGVLLYLSLSTHYAYISTCGTAQIYYYNGGSDDRISSIVSGMGDYLRREDYAGAVNYFCRQLVYYKEKGAPKDGYTVNDDNGEYAYYQNGELIHSETLPWWFGVRWSMMLPISGIIGVITELIAVLCVKSSYKLKKSLSPMNYVSQQDTHFYVEEDLFLRKHVSKTHISSDSGRSGGGGGGGHSHTSSGGFSHGGGGGHW